MFIFGGNFNWDSFIVDETVSIVLPSTGFRSKDPIYILFQWTEEPFTHSTLVAACFSSTISSVTIHLGVITIIVNFGAKYSLTATIGVGFTGPLSLIMSGEGLSPSDSCPLTNVLADTAQTLAVTRIYTGTFTWTPYVNNQLVTIIVPYGVINGVFVCLFHKWTECPVSPPSPNASDIFFGIFTDVHTAGNTTVASCLCTTTGFKCTFTFQADLKTGFFRLWVSEALTSPQIDFSLKF